MALVEPGEDFDIDLGLQFEITKAVEQRNIALAMHESPAVVGQTKISGLTLLWEFLEKIQANAHSNHLVALRGLNELQQALVFLIRNGLPEFKSQVRLIERGFERISRAVRHKLIRAFLSPATAPEDVERISQTLVHIIESGTWPDWQREFNAEVEAEVERRCGGSR